MTTYDWMLLGYVLFVALNAIDLFMTKVILENGGKEWNFIARFFYNRMGIRGIVWLKAVMLVCFGVQLYFKVLDLYVIYYLNFTFAVVLYLMYRDAASAGLRGKLSLARYFERK